MCAVFFYTASYPSRYPGISREPHLKECNARSANVRESLMLIHRKMAGRLYVIYEDNAVSAG